MWILERIHFQALVNVFQDIIVSLFSIVECFYCRGRDFYFR